MNLTSEMVNRKMHVSFVAFLCLLWGIGTANAADAEHGEHGCGGCVEVVRSDDHATGKHDEHKGHEEHGKHEKHRAGEEPAEDEHGEHEGHDHGEEDHGERDHGEKDHREKDHGQKDHGERDHGERDHGEEGDHSGHDHDEHGEEEEGLRLTPEQRKRFGIVVWEAGPGSLRSEVSLPGEVVFNDDRVVHLVPRAAGIAVDIYKTLGDVVKAGEPLALIDSVELAEAKLEYLSAVTEVGCCQFELPRAQAIHDNTAKMLALLESAPSVEQLREAAPGEMGDFRSRLISSYAEYVLTKKAYERERTLLSKKISSEGDFLAAESAFKKAQAEYDGTRESVAFEVKQNLLETTRDRQLAEFKVETTKQKLHLLGVTEVEVAGLATMAPPGVGAAEATAHECSDPNCKDCADHGSGSTDHKPVASRPGHASLGSYQLKSPFGGVIVQKHITRGERVGEDSDIFTIVDTSSVWVNLTVYSKHLAEVRAGQEVVLRVEHSGVRGVGTVAMVTPFVDPATRSATARVVLDNREGLWTPGTFVTGFVSRSQDRLAVVVPRQAVQRIEGRDVVFVEHSGAFEATPVTLGRGDRTRLEVVAGLKAGTRYVVEGAFQLKATLVTSNLGSHAGHGH